jgi:hypothetical protein
MSILLPDLSDIDFLLFHFKAAEYLIKGKEIAGLCRVLRWPS